MLTKYIEQQLKKAKYEILDDGKYYGEIPGVDGVWASERTLEKCRTELQEILEEWLTLKLKAGDQIPGLAIPAPKHSSDYHRLYA